MKNIKTLSILILLSFSLLLNAQTDAIKLTEGNSSIANNNKFYESDFDVKGSSQIKMVKRANKFFEDKEFAEAIPLYERALVGNETNKTILANLSECYRLTKDIHGQLKCYEALMTSNQADPIHELYYGDALMENGEYDLAKVHLEKFKEDDKLFGEYLEEDVDVTFVKVSFKNLPKTLNTDTFNVLLKLVKETDEEIQLLEE